MQLILAMMIKMKMSKSMRKVLLWIPPLTISTFILTKKRIRQFTQKLKIKAKRRTRILSQMMSQFLIQKCLLKKKDLMEAKVQFSQPEKSSKWKMEERRQYETSWWLLLMLLKTYLLWRGRLTIKMRMMTMKMTMMQIHLTESSEGIKGSRKRIEKLIGDEHNRGLMIKISTLIEINFLNGKVSNSNEVKTET